MKVIVIVIVIVIVMIVIVSGFAASLEINVGSGHSTVFNLHETQKGRRSW